MPINEKPPVEQEYVVIFRNNQAITLTCTDIRTSEGWVKFENEVGTCMMAAPAEIVLMILTPENWAKLQRAAKDAEAQQEAAQREVPERIVNVDPQGILDPSTQIIQP